MEFDFSSRFIRTDVAHQGIRDVWPKLCGDLLIAEFGTENFVRLDRRETGIDIYDGDSHTAFLCPSVDDPTRDDIEVGPAVESLQLAERQRQRFGWHQYVLVSNAVFAPGAVDTITKTLQRKPDQNPLIFIDPVFWEALCAKHPDVIRRWFDYCLEVSIESIVEALQTARYYESYIREYEGKIREADFQIRLTNNRCPLELTIPFSPELTVKNLLDVGEELLDIHLESTPFPDLATSAKLEISITRDKYAQPFKKKLSEIGVHSGSELQFWIKIIWEEVSRGQQALDWKPENELARILMKNRNRIPHKIEDALKPSLRYFSVACEFHRSFFNKDPQIANAGATPKDIGEATIARKLESVRGAIWDKATKLFSSSHRRQTTSKDDLRQPVRIGATAPESAEAGGSFKARLVVYHPDLEPKISQQLEGSVPGGKIQLDQARATWEIGTKVTVRAYGKDLVVEPECDEFHWNGEKHFLDFRVEVARGVTGTCDLKFDIYVEGFRVCRLWLEVKIDAEAKGRIRTKTTSSPQTAFASYSSHDRLRVLDRVASLEIRTGMRIFLDCVSMRPNARWRELLPEMIKSSDLLLLFWSRSARESNWVNGEWRLAFDTKGIAGIEVHPLETYRDAPLPNELADLIHGGDPLMVLRDNENR